MFRLSVVYFKHIRGINKMSHWLLSNVGKNVGRAGIWILQPCIDSPELRVKLECSNKGILFCLPFIAMSYCCIKFTAPILILYYIQHNLKQTAYKMSSQQYGKSLWAISPCVTSFLHKLRLVCCIMPQNLLYFKRYNASQQDTQCVSQTLHR